MSPSLRAVGRMLCACPRARVKPSIPPRILTIGWTVLALRSFPLQSVRIHLGRSVLEEAPQRFASGTRWPSAGIALIERTGQSWTG